MTETTVTDQSRDTGPDSVTREIRLPVPPAAAWTGFIDDFALWWPREHCFVGAAALDRVFIDLDARLWGEVALEGRVVPWGAVIKCRPPTASQPGRLVLGWQMDATVSPWVPEPDPGRASLVEIDFAASEQGTRVTLRHHGFERQGGHHARAMRAVMIGLDRWTEWLAFYAESLGARLR